tara:strand:+ start:256 stop:816 length:561 start_codon:yes stop_codon:yes gene_type:complete
MSYKLYTDKQEIFECKITLEGASLSKATSRILVETKDLKLMFEGKIDKDGNCKVPIKKLKGLLGETDVGTMKLEVIAEDTYFLPWKSGFTIDTSKKVKVQVRKQNKKDEWMTGRPSPQLVVSEVKNYVNPTDKISRILRDKGVTLKIVLENKKQFVPLLMKYHEKSKSKKNKKHFIKEVVTKLKRN